MSKIIDELKKNDRVQNQLALYFLFEYGRISLLDDSICTSIKEKAIKPKSNSKIITDDYMISSIDVARKMAKLSVNDLCKFIYGDVKEQKRQERSR